MAGIDWRGLLTKVSQYIAYFAPFYLIGFLLEGAVDAVLRRWFAGKLLVQAWLATWDSPTFGGKGEQRRLAWYYPILLAGRTSIGPLALILTWRWSSSLLWLRLLGGAVLLAALYLVLRRSPAVERGRTLAPTAPSAIEQASTLAPPASPFVPTLGSLGETAAVIPPTKPVGSIGRWRPAANAFLDRTVERGFGWLGAKATIILLIGGFASFYLPYQLGKQLFGGILPVLLLPLLGLLFPFSAGAEMAVIITLGSKGMSLGAGLAFILAAPLLYQARLEEVELQHGAKVMHRYLAVVWLVAVSYGLLMYFIFPGRLL